MNLLFIRWLIMGFWSAGNLFFANTRPLFHRNNSLKQFIPAGYVILDKSEGDINGDGLLDEVLILKQKQEVTEAERRPVIILLRQRNGSLKKVAENDNIVLSLGDGGIHGDPYASLKVISGVVNIKHFGGSGWRWSQEIIFKYNRINHNLFLYKTIEKNWHINSPKVVKEGVKTSKDFGLITFASYKNPWRKGE